jgi:ribosomal protein S27E
MSNYFSTVRCPHCGHKQISPVYDLGHQYPFCVFDTCKKCNEVIISEDFNKYAETCAKKNCFCDFEDDNENI